MVRLLACVVACSLVCLACIGCGPDGPELGTVSGKVTMDGQPLTNGLITFEPEAGGRASIGKTDSNGQYKLIRVEREGAEIGSHKVSVTTITEAEAVEDMGSDSDAYAKQAMGDASAYDSAEVAEPIPARYNVSTELVKEVKAGDNTIDLELTSQ